MKQKDSVNGSIRGRLPDGTANPVDLHVGAQLKKARLKMGMSQEKLAEEMGITFQQVQKYEKGLNRIGASRLWDLSQVLHKPISYFYEGMKKDTQEKSPRKINSLAEDDSAIANIGDLSLTATDLEVIYAFKHLHNEAIAQNVLNLIRTLAIQESNETCVNITDEKDDGCSIDDTV